MSMILRSSLIAAAAAALAACAPVETAEARERWRVLKQTGADLAYWKQTDEGWQRAA